MTTKLTQVERETVDRLLHSAVAADRIGWHGLATKFSERAWAILRGRTLT